jgi:hypothetical protein
VFARATSCQQRSSAYPTCPPWRPLSDLRRALSHLRPASSIPDASLSDLDALRLSSASFAAALAEAEAIHARVSAAAAAPNAAAPSAAAAAPAGAEGAAGAEPPAGPPDRVADAGKLGSRDGDDGDDVGMTSSCQPAEDDYDPMELTKVKTRHLWLGNLNSRLPRSALRQVRASRRGRTPYARCLSPSRAPLRATGPRPTVSQPP